MSTEFMPKYIKPVFIHFCKTTERIVVTTVKHWDLKSVDVAWMRNPVLVGHVLVPDIDIMDKEFFFPNNASGTAAAMHRVAQLYAEQLEESPDWQNLSYSDRQCPNLSNGNVCTYDSSKGTLGAVCVTCGMPE